MGDQDWCRRIRQQPARHPAKQHLAHAAMAIGALHDPRRLPFRRNGTDHLFDAGTALCAFHHIGMDAVAGPMMRQMKQLGVSAKFMGGDGICTSELVKLAAEGMGDENVFCAEAGGVEGEQKAGMDKFRADFKAKYNAEVQVYAPYVYDAVKVMAQAMVTAGSADPAKYLPALKSINYKGVTGNIAFDEKGDIKNGALTLFTYKGGKREQIAVVR